MLPMALCSFACCGGSLAVFLGKYSSEVFLRPRSWFYGCGSWCGGSLGHLVVALLGHVVVALLGHIVLVSLVFSLATVDLLLLECVVNAAVCVLQEDV